MPNNTALVLKSDQKVTLSVAFFDAAGNPAVVDGIPVWSVSAPGVVTLHVAEDGRSAVAVADGPAGTVTISVVADADLGEGSREIVGVLGIQVVSGEAVFVALSAGTPEPK